MSKSNPYAPNSGSRRVAPKVVEDKTAIVDGTIKEVLERVGDDPEKASEALEAEQSKDHPRSTLVAALTDLLPVAEEEGEDDE